MTMQQIPDLIDNERCQLAEALKDLLADSHDPRLDVVAAFFNLRGLEALEPELQQLVALRLLLGKEQEQAFVLGERLLAELEDATARGETTAREIQRWRDFLSQTFVDVRRYAKAFLHGKAYIVHGVPNLGAVGIVGSSNFTGAGLTTNRELNAVLKQSSAVRELQDWFEVLWQEAEDYKAELLELLERFTRIYSPYEIYIKVLYEAMRDQLDQELGEQGEKPSPIALADFQHDGYLAAREIIENYGGVLIADSVGLGKTYLALRLLDDYAYGERQTALIVCPAAIRETVWRPLLQRFSIPYELVSMEEVSRREFPADEYARHFQVIVVDESHNFRNPRTNRWENLFRVITKGDSDKKVILLTATPVNNTVFDLYHQLCLIARGRQDFLLVAGISDLSEYFRRAEENKEALYEVLEALAVRRSRPFIRQNYPEAEIDGRRIRFPDRELHTVRYRLKDAYGPNLYRKIAQTIEDLLLAPYQVETYRKEFIEARRHEPSRSSLFEGSDEGEQSMMNRLQSVLGWSHEQAHEFLMTVGRQRALAHIMRVLYLKRLESSLEALRISLRRLHCFLEQFLQVLNAGRLLNAEDYRRWLQIEGADEEGVEEEARWEAFLNSLPELPAELYDIAKLRTAVEADLKSLQEILRELEQDRPDGKLETLKKLLASEELRGQKIVLFSYFKDTARYLHKCLTRDHVLAGRRLDIVDSDVRPSERTERIQRFAPRANRRLDLSRDKEIDILISTDVLSEGQNLQDANIIINYDLHWNPVRMVQRVGRLDRLGSPHSVIHVYNFFPEEELEELLGLLERLREKLDDINRTVGLDASILGETPNPMDFNILRRLERGDRTVLQELEAESELTVGEFLKQDLLRFLKDVGEEKLNRIPLGVGTARRQREGPRGFFAAFRNPKTGQHHWLFYNEEEDRIVERRLEAIRSIRCESSEPAEPLPEGFDPRDYIFKLRRHLWNCIRRASLAPRALPSPQRQIVNWLHTFPPTAERNRLLEYFEARALNSLDLKELRRLWRERSTLSLDQLIKRLIEFAKSHPYPLSATPEVVGGIAPEREEDLECIAWMKVF
jgi:superfamily II DNA or RNA helicase